MDFAGLGYGYCLTCISILLPIIVAGYVSTVAYTFFEKNNSAEIATKKSILCAITAWVILQTVSCLLIIFSDTQLMM